MSRGYNQRATLVNRNHEIWLAYANGMSVPDIAARFDLGETRVYEVIHQVAETIPDETRGQVAKMRRSSIDMMRERVAEIMSQPPKKMYAPNGRELPELDFSEILAAVDRGIKLDERLARLTGTDMPARTQVDFAYAEQAASERQAADWIREQHRRLGAA
jgi:transposase